MSSTEFTAGIGDGARVSSKVLKPPGGGSSDIFGFGAASDNCNSEKVSKTDSSTKSRLFGDPSDPLPPKPNKNTTLHQSSIFDNDQVPTTTSKRRTYVRRNPITGEEIEMSLENENGRGNDCDNKEKEEKAPESSPKPVQTSIRVRNPPGGKSSGIF